VWKNYLDNKDFIEENFAKYDTNHSGKLELDQLKLLLTGMAVLEDQFLFCCANLECRICEVVV
jgi:Ca2+-binding EF-hand superfamily protein